MNSLLRRLSLVAILVLSSVSFSACTDKPNLEPTSEQTKKDASVEKQVEPVKEATPEPRPEPRTEPRPEPQQEPASEPQSEPKAEPQSEPRPEPKAEPDTSEPTPDAGAEPVADGAHEVIPEPSRETTPETTSDTIPPIHTGGPGRVKSNSTNVTFGAIQDVVYITTGSNNGLTIAMGDIKNLCQAMRQSNPPSQKFGLLSFVFTSLPSAQKYTVGSGLNAAMISRASSTAPPVQERALSGSVTLSKVTISPTDKVEGSFSLTFSSGTITGTFRSSQCKGLTPPPPPAP